MPDHGNCHTKPCRSLRCPAEIDRLPLVELRRFAHHQRCLINAFRRQHNYHLDYIRDLEQRIKTMERQLRLVAHIAEIDSGVLEDQVRDIERKLTEGWVPPARSAAEIVDELRREEANRG